MILLDDQHIIVTYHEDEKCLDYMWKDFVPSILLRERLEKVIKWIEEYKAEALINNLKHVGAVSKEDQMWIAKVFSPALVNAKLKYSVIVLPTSIFGKLANEEVERNIGSNSIITKHFNDSKKALEWIADMQKS